MLSIVKTLLKKILDDIDSGNSNITEEEGKNIIVCYDVFLGEWNAGFTHTNYGTRLSIVGIGLTTSKEQLMNTIVHEAKHVLSHICKYYDVPEDGELAAYLIGFIVMRMFKMFKCLLR